MPVLTSVIVFATNARTCRATPTRVQRYLDRFACPHHRAEGAERNSAGADVLHGAQIQLEMTDKEAIGIDIRLLTDHDIIDQAGRLGIIRRKPRHRCACHVLLLPPKQRHEIPNGKNVIFHKAP